MATLNEDRYTFVSIQDSFLLGMRNVSENVTEKIKTHILCSVIFLIVPFMRKCEKNTAERSRPQTTILPMRFACWIPKVTNTHTQVV